jgi:hypothetical protein
LNFGTSPAPFVAGPPPPAGVCNALIVIDPQLALVNPGSGAQGVPTTIGSITFSASGLYYSLALLPSDGSGQVVGGTITAAGSGRYVSALPVLKSGVTYTVLIYPAAGFACAYFPGSFTTL